MTDQAIAEVDTPSYLDMSDDDIMAMGAPTHMADAPAVAEEQADPTDDVADTAEAAVETPAEEETVAAEQKPDAVNAEAPDEGGEQPTEKEAPVVAADDAGKPAVVEKETPAPSESVVEIDYKAGYEKILAPFKANGKDIQVKNVDDAVALMQQGANYNKKMAALKPNLKLMRSLENAGLLSEEKIGFLIDLAKKDPGAINRLVQDSGIDPMDLSAEKAGEYKQSSYTVGDSELELDSVLEEIQHSPTFNRTLEVISTKWDGDSKQVIVSQPELIKVINSHMQSGIYDLINQEVENERVFGRLKGLSDIEAYKQVGDVMQAKGRFNHVVSDTQVGDTPPAPVTTNKPLTQVLTPVPPKSNKAEQDKLNEQRRAASSTKPVASASTKPDFNPLSVSDEEFAKLSKNY